MTRLKKILLIRGMQCKIFVYSAYFLLAIFCTIVVGANAQVLDPTKDLTQYNIDHWSDDDFPSSGVQQVLQTGDGYLWLATFHGLFRFDGVTFKKYDKYTTPELTDIGYRSLYEDRDNRLWVGGVGGGLYMLQDDHFSHIEVPYGSSSNNIRKIFQDSKQRLWLGTLRGLVLLEDSVFALVVPPGISTDVDVFIQDIEEDADGNIWVAAGNSIYKYIDDSLQVYAPHEDSGLGEIRDILAADDKLWIISYDKGVYVIVDDKIEKFAPLENVTQPLTLYEDRSGSIWVSTEVGVVRYNQYGTSALDASSGLSDSHVNSIVQDHEGSIWLGTYYGGLNRIRDGVFINYTVLNGLSDNTVHCVTQTANGAVWVGSEQGINIFNDDNHHFYQPDIPLLAEARVRHIFEDSQGYLWVATYSGLFRVRHGQVTEITMQSGLSNNQVRVVMEDKSGLIWVGTRNGLNRFDGKQWKQYTREDGMISDFIMSLEETDNGNILIGTVGGLQILAGDTIKPYNQDNEYLTRTIFYTLIDEAGILWICTSAGLLGVDGDIVYSYSQDHELLGTNIYQVLIDRKGQVWLTTDSGIVQISRQELMKKLAGDAVELEPVLFDKSNGLRTNNITPVSKAFKTAGDNIWFCTLAGVAIIDPDSLSINEIPPPIVVNKVVIAGEEKGKGTIDVRPGSRNIEIHYAGLSYMIPKKVNFKYMLEGYDEDWQDVGERRTAYYSTLPPGEYRFKVAACNNDGVWNIKETDILLRVKKAFWQTSIFYVLAIIFSGLVIAGVMNLRSRRIREVNRQLEEKIMDRTKEVLLQKEEIEAQRDDIESKNHELERARDLIAKQYNNLQEVNENLEEKVNLRTKELQEAYSDLIHVNQELDDFVYKSAHDIKGPVARLRGLCNLALMEVNEPIALAYIQKLQQESTAANAILEKLSRAHEFKTLKPYFEPVLLYTAIYDVIKRLKLNEEVNDVQFDISVDANLVIATDSKLFGELLYNLLENAVIFRTPNKPMVKISCHRTEGEIVLTIEDNGLRIEKKIQPDIFKIFIKGSERSKGLGLGLYIARQAAESLGGNLRLEKSDSQGNVFTLNMPLYADIIKDFSSEIA